MANPYQIIKPLARKILFAPEGSADQYSAFDPAHNAGMTLTGDNRVAELISIGSVTNAPVVGTDRHTTGTWYCEFEWLTGARQPALGLGNAQLANDDTAMGGTEDSIAFFNGLLFDISRTLVSGLLNYVIGDRVSFLVTPVITLPTIYEIYVNGVLAHSATTDMSFGSPPGISFSASGANEPGAFTVRVHTDPATMLYADSIIPVGGRLGWGDNTIPVKSGTTVYSLFDGIVGTLASGGKSVILSTADTATGDVRHNSGVHYVELTLIAGDTNEDHFGLGSVESGDGTYLGSTVNGLAVTTDGLIKHNGATLGNFVAFDEGDIIGIVADLDLDEYHFYLNGQFGITITALDADITANSGVSGGIAFGVSCSTTPITSNTYGSKTEPPFTYPENIPFGAHLGWGTNIPVKQGAPDYTLTTGVTSEAATVSASLNVGGILETDTSITAGSARSTLNAIGTIALTPVIDAASQRVTVTISLVVEGPAFSDISAIAENSTVLAQSLISANNTANGELQVQATNVAAEGVVGMFVDIDAIALPSTTVTAGDVVGVIGSSIGAMAENVTVLVETEITVFFSIIAMSDKAAVTSLLTIGDDIVIALGAISGDASATGDGVVTVLAEINAQNTPATVSGAGNVQGIITPSISAIAENSTVSIVSELKIAGIISVESENSTVSSDIDIVVIEVQSNLYAESEKVTINTLSSTDTLVNLLSISDKSTIAVLVSVVVECVIDAAAENSTIIAFENIPTIEDSEDINLFGAFEFGDISFTGDFYG